MDPGGANLSLDPDMHLHFVALLAELSSRFISLPPGDVDREIEDALRRVCELLGIEMAVLWQWSPAAPGSISPTHAYPSFAGPGTSELSAEEQFPWVRQEVLAGRTVVLPSVEESLPAEAATDRESALRLGIKSSLTLPLSVGGEPPVGALAFNMLRAQRDWSDALLERLQLVAQVLTNALVRRRHEASLQESEEVSRATFDQAAVGIAHVGTDGRWLRVNDKLCAIVGYPREELLQLTFQDITHPDDLETDLDYVRQVLSGEVETYSTEKRYIRKDLSLVWINLTVSLVRTAAGEPRHFISVVEDITKRKRGEEALRVSEARLAAGADLAGLGFYEIDFGDGVAFVDDRFRKLCGLSPEGVQGLQALGFWMDHLHPDDRQRVLDIRQQLHNGTMERISLEYRFLDPVHGEKWIQHLAGVAARDAAGCPVKTFGVLRDITARKQSEEALRQSYAEIERLKDRLQAESDYLKAEIGGARAQGKVTGQSGAVKRVLRLVEQVAPTDSSVLIQGETGTGKELIAQAIHQLSPRRRHVMIKVSCAALPSGLVESELFGREKGAFTGALTRQVGRFEVADGSTLFLDEVGELPLDVQVKLLRVLQEGEFERLGSPRTVKVNVRVIAATNRDLSDEV